MTPTLRLLAGSLSALALTACVESTVPPLLPDPGPDGTYTVDWPDLGDGADRFITIDIGPDTLQSCRKISPKFPFDSGITRAQDRAQIAAFVSCLNHESMTDRTVLLVGRADAKGSAEYNQALGKKRAQNIKKLLVADGLAEGRITVMTAGEAEALGDTPDYSPGYDRRVDVIIVGGAHTP